jgi:hypothetical protein
MKQLARQTWEISATLQIFCADDILNRDTYLRNYDAFILALAQLHPLSISKLSMIVGMSGQRSCKDNILVCF